MDWIPVSERLPDDDSPVLLWWLRGGVDDVTGRPKPIACIGRYVHSLREWRPAGGNGNFNREITHWMQLPGPPNA